MLNLRRFRLPLDLNPHEQGMILEKKPVWSLMRKKVSLYRKYLVYNMMSEKPMERTLSLVNNIYQTSYAVDNDHWVMGRNARKDFFVFRGQLLLCNGWFLTSVYNRILSSIIEIERPQTVLEIGSGRAKNLLNQALRHGDIRFSGCEYSYHGVVNGNDLIDNPPSEIINLTGKKYLKKDEQNSLRERVSIIHGNAYSLPFPDNSFDLTFTCLVLEQMPDRYIEALKEIRRCTRSLCVFIEPFAEANGFIGKSHLKFRDYFRFGYQQFKHLGLDPIFFSTHLPQKLKYRVGVLATAIRK